MHQSGHRLLSLAARSAPRVADFNESQSPTSMRRRAQALVRHPTYADRLDSVAGGLPAFVSACILLALIGCASHDREVEPAQTHLFRVLSPEQTGIDFRNTLSEAPTPHRNELLYEYFSNGGGVAVGDLNGDGLDDIYFSGNMTYNRLYLNKGNMVFEDVTQASGVAGRRDTWKTGVTIVDVNGDGLLDIYVCYSGDLPLERRIDELYINQGTDENGIPLFEEQAREYGLANPHSSNQAYFFDYDRDGDLDLFLLTHNVKSMPRQDSEETRELVEKEDPISGVRLYRNTGNRFEDVTSIAGIQSSSLTYGLGAGVSDLNKDGWIDIYVGNDYSPPDYLYMNNGDGTFSNEIDLRIGHISNASMGIDVADVNNDGWSDIIVLDMLAEDNRRQKTLFISNDRDAFSTLVRSGFHYQYTQNTLQLNNGDGTFSEIAQLAGISSTDWSWAPLIADYDNDGRKDVFVTNGILHDIIDLDFLVFKNDYIRSRRQNLEPSDVAYLMENLPSSDLNNYAFRNLGGLRFQDVSADWGLDKSLKSTGAAYADLDNDGDLDLITNNINEHALIFENRSTEVSENNYLRIDLRGEGMNTAGIGAKVTLYVGGEQQYIEQMPMRGYLSSVSPTLHFGLGQRSYADSLQVLWPDGREQTLRDVKANRRLSILQEHATEPGDSFPTDRPVFEEVPSPIDFTHRMAGEIDDFRRQPLLVNPKSFSGPPLAKADVDGDGLDDIFVGGGIGQPGRLYLQQPDGKFAASPQPAFEADSNSHDVAAAFLDSNGDGHLDLYVASGGYGNFAPDDPALQDRLYVNDGRGHFVRKENALPEMRTSTGAVAATDINGDGHLDLFVGGYVVPGRYPEAPRSYLLVNDGRGHFADRTAEVGPALERIGMVSDAVWHDLNGDGEEELIVVGEWMPISVFENSDGILSNETQHYFEKPYSGLWNKLLVDDLNRDGIADLVVGNLGLNSQLKASEDQPAELFYADFDYSGSIDPILTFYVQGTRYPHVTLDELRGQMPRIASRFSSYGAFAEAKMEEIFAQRELEIARRLKVTFLETALFIGTQSRMFEKRALPIEAQFSPVFTIHSMDYDGDGHTDLILGGNANEARIRFGKYDASYGMLLRGDGNASFDYIPQYESGLSLRGDLRSILEIDDTLLFGVHDNALRAYRMTTPSGLTE